MIIVLDYSLRVTLAFFYSGRALMPLSNQQSIIIRIIADPIIM